MISATYPHGQSLERQIRYFKNPSGAQRFRCLACVRDYTPQPKPHAYEKHLHQEALKLSLEGQSFRHIARLLSVNHQTVVNGIRGH